MKKDSGYTIAGVIMAGTCIFLGIDWINKGDYGRAIACFIFPFLFFVVMLAYNGLLKAIWKKK